MLHHIYGSGFICIWQFVYVACFHICSLKCVHFEKLLMHFWITLRPIDFHTRVTYHCSLLDTVAWLDDGVLLSWPAQKIWQLVVGALHGLTLQFVSRVTTFMLKDNIKKGTAFKSWQKRHFYILTKNVFLIFQDIIRSNLKNMEFDNLSCCFIWFECFKLNKN